MLTASGKLSYNTGSPARQPVMTQRGGWEGGGRFGREGIYTFNRV